MGKILPFLVLFLLVSAANVFAYGKGSHPSRDTSTYGYDANGQLTRNDNGRNDSDEVKRGRMSPTQVIEVAKVFAEKKGKILSEYQEPRVSYKNGAWHVFFTANPPGYPGGHFSITVSDKSGKPLRLIPGR